MDMPPLLGNKRRRGLAVVAALTLVQGAAAAAAALATRRLFETMDQGTSLPVAMLAVLVGAGAVIALTRIVARVQGERLGQDFARDIRAALFTHASMMPAGAVAQRRSGYMSLRFVGDMTAFRNWPGLGLPRLIAGAIMIPATLAVLWVLSPAFALAILPVLAVTLGLLTLGGLRLVRLQRRLRMRRGRIAAEMAERMPLAPHLDRLGRRPRELALLDKRTDAMITAAIAHRRVAETLRALPDIASGIGAAVIIMVGQRGGLSAGTIAAGLAALGLLLQPLRDLGGVWNHRAAYQAAAAKATQALSRQQRDLYKGRKSLTRGPAAVQFDRVALPSGALLDLTIDAGQFQDLPLAGVDAAAVADMLLGLDMPRTGRILLDGTEMKRLSRGTLRRGVHRINDMPEILQGSLRRVLLMGNTDGADDRTVLRLTGTEGLSPLLDRLGGLEGTVREGGRNLTRDERIAVNLVRMRLLRPKLIVIDRNIGSLATARIKRHLRRSSATVLRMTAPVADPADGSPGSDHVTAGRAADPYAGEAALR